MKRLLQHDMQHLMTCAIKQIARCTEIHSSRRSISVITANDGKHDIHGQQPRKMEHVLSQHRREQWNVQNWNTFKQDKTLLLQETEHLVPHLETLYDSFKQFSLSLKSKTKGKNQFCIITAWLISDNVLVDLFNRLAKDLSDPDLLPQIIAIDTLHLFKETIETAELIKQIYPEIMQNLQWVKPNKCQTREEFNQLYGQYHDLPETVFDYWTKVEPLQRALRIYQKNPILNPATSQRNEVIVVTGRRNDQGNQRTVLSTWEQDKMTYNPLVNWTWNDLTSYVQHYNIVVNPLHKRIYLDPFNRFIGKKDRDTYTNFLEITLDFPYFYYNLNILRQLFESKEHKMNFYVWKSFGDTLTSVPVTIHESEREGRFVHRQASECGIHTRVSTTKKAPHGGGDLVNLISPIIEDDSSRSSLSEEYNHVIELNERQVCDLELLMNGGYSPLRGFMNQAEYEACIHNMRLPEGSLWGLPIVLDSHDASVQKGERLLLRSSIMGGDLAVMEVEDVWKPDKTIEALKIFNTTSHEHPYIEYMKTEMGILYFGGPITKGIKLPERLWLTSKHRVATPQELRDRYRHSSEVIAFQCRNPLHRAHVEMFNAQNKNEVQVVVHPTIGPSKQDDFDARIRVPTYEVLQPTLQQQKIDVFYLPYHMRLAGPRETLQHLICRKNYGFTQMIIGRDHAGCKDKSGNDFFSLYEGQELAEKYSEELGIRPISFKALVYVPEKGVYVSKQEAQENLLKYESISGTEFRRRIDTGKTVPDWYAFPEVVRLLEASFRYHITNDPTIPQQIVKTTAQPTALLHIPLVALNGSMSDQIVSLSRKYPSIPFFVIHSSSTYYQIISPSRSNFSKSNTSKDGEQLKLEITTLNSFDMLQHQLSTLDRP